MFREGTWGLGGKGKKKEIQQREVLANCGKRKICLKDWGLEGRNRPFSDKNRKS